MTKTDIKSNTMQSIHDLDRTIHAPARLMILAYLSVVESADFTFLLNQTGLSRGNLSTHLGRLEEAGYILVSKEFVDRVPHTLICLSDTGREAIEVYRENMQTIISTLLSP
jgi:DNA-binding MarR family transcriptional regulator